MKQEVTSPQAFEYIRGQLESQKTLSRFLNQQDIKAGRVYSFVPENTSENQLYNFKSGGLNLKEKKLINGTWLSKIINEAKPKIKDIINVHIKSSILNNCIFEDCNGTPNSLWVINSRIEYVNFKDKMYYFFDKEKNNNKEELEKAFLFSGGWYFFCGKFIRYRKA